MSTIQRAREHDRDERLLPAFECYLDAIEAGKAEAEDYLAASFLGFIFQDHGVAHKFQLSEETVRAGRKSMRTLLAECERKFGPSDEIEFWRKYYDLILEGKTEYDRSCQEFLSRYQRVSVPLTEQQRYLNSLSATGD